MEIIGEKIEGGGGGFLTSSGGDSICGVVQNQRDPILSYQREKKGGFSHIDSSPFVQYFLQIRTEH